MTTIEKIEELHERRWREADERARKILYGETVQKEEPAPEESKTESTETGELKIRVESAPGKEPRTVSIPLPEQKPELSKLEMLQQKARQDRVRPKGNPEPKHESEKTPHQKYQDMPLKKKGFSPGDREKFNARMKEQGIVTMTPDGVIDSPKGLGRGAFRRS